MLYMRTEKVNILDNLYTGRDMGSGITKNYYSLDCYLAQRWNSTHLSLAIERKIQELEKIATTHTERC